MMRMYNFLTDQIALIYLMNLVNEVYTEENTVWK